MRNVQTTLYTFDELSDHAKSRVIEKFYDINLYDKWYEFIYEDAERIGLKINDFDIYRRTIYVEFTDTPEDTANEIIKEHGSATGTYMLAEYYIRNLNELKSKQTFDEYGDSDMDEDIEDLNEEFLNRLGEEFLSYLTTDYEWRISESAIAEYVTDNNYEFTEYGEIY